MIALFGLPHGATDWVLARHTLRPRLGPAWAPAFAAFYGLGMLLAAAAAIAAPGLTMLIFIATAIWHFGAEDAGIHGRAHSALAIAAFGIPPIAGPALFWPAGTAAILHNLGLGCCTPHMVALAGAAGAALWLFAAVATLRDACASRWAIAIELASLIALEAAAPPLLAFTTYFCLIHSPRHISAFRRDLGGASIAGDRRAIMGATAAAVALIAVAAGQAASLREAGSTWAATNGVFWGLAALTLPHVLFGRIAASLRNPNLRAAAVPPCFDPSRPRAAATRPRAAEGY